MIIELSVEEQIAALLRDAIARDNVVVTSAWAVALEGDEKGVERPDEAARVVVAVGAPAFDTYETPTAELPVAVSVAVRRESDPTGALLADLLSAVEGVRLPFHLSREALAEVSTESFDACGARADSGEPPSYNAALNAWNVTRTFSLKGVIKL